MNLRVIAAAAYAVVSLAAQSQPQNPFPDLVGGIQATPGCLGVETARTASGKNVIFAWFEDKQAVLRWYNSEMHRQLVRMSGPPQPGHVPMAGIADDSGPILAIASVTLADPTKGSSPVPGAPPISQISIELYQPLPGGLFVGGRFAPGSVKVPGMRDFTPAHAGAK